MNPKYYLLMKNFIVNLFRKFPGCTGVLLLLLALHLTGVKDLRTSMVEIQDDLFLVFYLYVLGMLFFVMFLLPKVEPSKREKITWMVVVLSVLVLTIIAKIFIA